MASLAEWKVFCQWLRERDEAVLPEDVSLPELNRFAARYRLADSFEQLVVTDYAAETADAYSALMKAFLAYSALEQFHKAVKPSVPNQHLIQRWATASTEIAAELREEKEIIDFLAAKMDSPQLQKRLHGFLEGETDNCLAVATALRNAVAHGMMSVHPDGTSARAAENFCDRISEMLILISEQAFSDWCRALPEYPLPEYPEKETHAMEDFNQLKDLATAG